MFTTPSLGSSNALVKSIKNNKTIDQFVSCYVNSMTVRCNKIFFDGFSYSRRLLVVRIFKVYYN